jgi:hypothetical protein
LLRQAQSRQQLLGYPGQMRLQLLLCLLTSPLTQALLFRQALLTLVCCLQQNPLHHLLAALELLHAALPGLGL